MKFSAFFKKVWDREPKSDVLRQPIYMGNNKVLAFTLFGQKLYLDSRDISLSPHIIIDGYWEYGITKAIKSLIKPGMTVVEIGANLGYYTTLMGSIVEEWGQIHAFEANVDMLDLLSRNVTINGLLNRTTLINKVVHERTSELNFFVLERYQGSSSTIPFTEEFLAFYNDRVKKITVPSISLDDYWERQKTSRPIDFIKIDAEGSEPFIFTGMKKILSSHKHLRIVCEFNKSILERSDWSPSDFIDMILSNGFALSKITQEGKIIPVNRDEILKTQRQNEELVLKK